MATRRGVMTIRMGSGVRNFAGLGALFLSGLAASGQTALTVSAPVFPITPVGQTANGTVTVTVNAGASAVLQSIAIAPGFGDFSLGSTAGCAADGVTNYVGGQSCTIAIAFSPKLPGNAAAAMPISRSAPLIITDVENGSAFSSAYAVGLTGGGTAPWPVVVPGLIRDMAGNDQLPAASQVGFAGDGGPASGAVFNGPTTMAVDAAGNIYISDTGNCVVRRIDKASGKVSTVAGIAPSPSPDCDNGTDGVAATMSALSGNVGIALDAAGNLYIADAGNGAIRMVSAASGLITTVAGVLNTQGFAGDGGPATSAELLAPSGIAVDGMGNLYIADAGNYVVRKVTGGTIQTIAGVPGQSGNPFQETASGPATQFLFSNLQRVAVDSQSNVYVTDLNSYAVLRIDAVSGTISALSNSLPGAPPIGMAFDASDSLYFTNYGDCNIYKQSNAGGNTLVVAGDSNCGVMGDGGAATSAGLNMPVGVVADSTGSFYILETEGVRFVDSSGASATPVMFAPQGVSDASAPMNVYLFDGDVATLAGAMANPLAVYFSGTTGPFAATAAPGGPDCSQATSGVSILLNPAAFCTLSLVFTPTTQGNATGSASLFESPGGSTTTQGFTLSGSGTAATTDTLTPGSASFSAAVNGGSSSATFILTNTGSAALVVSGIGFSNSAVSGFSELDNCGGSIPAGTQYSYCTITVTYRPTTAGSFSQTLYVLDNTSAGQETAPLNATATAPDATLSPASANLTSVVNEGGTPAIFTLTNTSATSPLTVTNITLSDPANYAQTNTCGTAVAMSSSCTITVSFLPGTTGSFPASLTVNDNAAGGSQITTLQGTAVVPIASLSTTSLSFTAGVGSTSVAQPVTISNTGTGPLTLSNFPTQLQGDQPTQFAFDTSACPAVLPAGTACTIHVYFNPTGGGTMTATLQIADDSGGVPIPGYVIQSVALTGVAPTNTPTIAGTNFVRANAVFPVIPVGTSETQTATLTLMVPIAIASFAIPSEFTEYTLIGVTGCVVDGVTVNPAGTVCGLQITFAPTHAGPQRNATLVYTMVEGGQPIRYTYGLMGASTGAVEALTPGIVTNYLAGTYVAQSAPSNFGQQAQFAGIGALGYTAMDPAGTLYATDDAFEVIYKVDTLGKFTLFAGTPFMTGGVIGNIGGDGGQAINASLGYVGRIATDPSGNLLFVGASDSLGNTSIRIIDTQTGIIQTHVGGGNGCPAQTDAFGDGCEDFQFAFPPFASVAGLALDSAANVYFNWTDTNMSTVPQGTLPTAGNYGVNRVDQLTGVVTVAAGVMGLTKGTGADGGPAVGAAISPGAMTVDSNGNLLLVDGNATVRMVNSQGIISTIAGFGARLTVTSQGCAGVGANGDGGPATAAAFSFLNDIKVDAANNIYLVDEGACVIRRIDAGTGIISTIAGPGFCGFGDCGNLGDAVGSSHGEANLAGFNRPGTLTFDPNWNLYVGDSVAVRKIDVSQSAMTFTRTQSGFAAIPIGSESGPVSVSVLNVGNAGTIDFLAPFTSAPSFGISTGDFTRDTNAVDCVAANAMLAPGFECSVNVDFTPTVSGAIADTLTITDSAGNHTVNLYGTAAGTAQVTLAPALTSLSAALNQSSTAQVLLTNNTANAITITSVSIIGTGAAAFGQANTCGTLLAANASCAIMVTYSPTTTAQSVAQVNVDYMLSSGGTMVATSSVASLVGVPSYANAALGSMFGVSELDFQTHAVGSTSAPLTTTLYSTGTAPLNITSMSITGADATQFAISGTSCGAALAVNASCTISITFTPLTGSAGTPPVAFQAYLTVTDNAPTGSQQEQLAGFGMNGATPLAIAETIHLSDAPTATLATPLVIVDNIQLSDLAAVMGASPLAISETITLSDAAFVGGTIPLAISETITLSDTPAAMAGFATTTTLSTNSLIAVYASPITFSTLTTSSGTSAVPTGSVTYFDGSTVLISRTLDTTGATSAPINSLSPGQHTITALYVPTGGFIGGTSGGITVLIQTVLTVTPISVSRSFETANPVFHYLASGLTDGDTGAVLSGQPTITTTAQMNSPAGSYPLHIVQGSFQVPSKYSLVLVDGTLTISGGAAQTITFQPIPSVPQEVGHITLTAHSTSGQPIVYSVSGPASINGSLLTLTGSGQVTVTATQPGNATFNAAAPVARTFVVIP